LQESEASFDHRLDNLIEVEAFAGFEKSEIIFRNNLFTAFETDAVKVIGFGMVGDIVRRVLVEPCVVVGLIEWNFPLSRVGDGKEVHHILLVRIEVDVPT
jgi:hypothetical protein